MKTKSAQKQQKFLQKFVTNAKIIDFLPRFTKKFFLHIDTHAIIIYNKSNKKQIRATVLTHTAWAAMFVVNFL